MSEKHEDYLGIFLEPMVQEKKRRKNYKHPIFLYSPENDTDDRTTFEQLKQVVNVYEHSLEDFEFNAKKIIQHYKENYGNASTGIFTIGQSIRFRVYKGQEPMDLSLFMFLMNYTMILVPILMGADMHDWKPWTPTRWTNKAWVNQMNHYIEMVRPYGNNRKIDELLEWSKYLMNLWAADTGDRIGLSISNNDFIEVAKRSKEAYESMTCTFPLDEDISPSDLEKITKDRTTDLLNIISDQSDLPISIYTKNGLFNPGQFREFAVHIAHKPDLYGNTIPFTSRTNVMMGLKDPRAHMIDAFGGRKAEIVKLNVSDAGALERSLCMLMSSLRFVDTDYECDSKHFRIRTIDNMDTLEKLDGRVCTLDPKSDEYMIIGTHDSHLIGKTVYLKTPITCTHPRRHEGYICSACYGKLMAALNRDVHIGRLAALNLSDDIEQKLLSAKHALMTNTNDIKFDTIFDTYFIMSSCQIYFNQSMIDASADNNEEFNHLHLEFHLSNMKKNQDGEGRHYDRSIPEIIIYDDRDDTRIIIKEENGAPIFLSQEFNNEYFLPAIKHKGEKDVVRIPFTDLIDTGNVCCDILFEYQYKNNDITGALLELDSILSKKSSINAYGSYDECLDAIVPLFTKGGIHIPEIQPELLISQMIYSPDGSAVDWTLDDPEYVFFTIDKSIQNNQSALTSVLYHETSRQIAGAYGTYEKSGTSAYDWFLYDGK